MKLNKLLVLLFLFITPLYSVTTTHPRAQAALQKIQQIPEVRTLIIEAEKRGPIVVRVETLPHDKFEAFWDSSNRIVRINEPFNKVEGVFIGSLLFELHNAATDQQLKHFFTLAREGRITKEKYVESIERIEHQNALNTSTLLEKGIRLGLFNQDARWPVYRDFDDHYKVQQLQHHSAWIANNYDRMRNQRSAEYQGTIAGLNTLSPEDRSALLAYLHIKNDLESPIDAQARRGMERLHAEQTKLENSLVAASPQERSNLKRRMAMMQDILKKHQMQGSPGVHTAIATPEPIPSS